MDRPEQMRWGPIVRADDRLWFQRMPHVDSTTDSVCSPRSFSALGDQRAEILPVQGLPALAGSGRGVSMSRK